MRLNRSRGVVAVAVLGGLALAACSSSSKSSSSSTTAQGSSATSASAGPTGAPLKVVAVTTPITASDVTNGLKMAEAYINGTGGIKGRPLQIIMCSDNQDPNAAATCIRNGISAGAVAELDRTSSYGASMNPIEQADGMADVGGGIYSQADFAAKNMFPLNAGIFSTIGSAPLAVTTLGAKRIGVPYVDVPAGAALPPTIKQVITPMGATVVGAVPISPTAADITPQVAAEVQANPDVVVDGLTEDAYVKLIKGMQQQGSNAKFMISSGVMDAGRMTTNFGADGKNIYQDAEDDYNSSGYQQFLAACQKYCPDPNNTTGNVIWAWESAVLLKTVAQQASTLDAKGIAAAIAQVTDFNIGNIIPTINFTVPGKALGGAAPRLFNDTLWMFQFQNGKLVPVGNGQGVSTLG
jgi:branched-chain amino acid transport system substrate-binding protein